jgi:hypothetical protein
VDYSEDANSVRIPIVAATVKAISNKTYSGYTQQPVPTVKLKGKALKFGADYTISYKNNIDIGKASVVIKGKGNYVGIRPVTFKIVPTKTSVSKAAVGEKQIKATWKPVAKAQKVTKYQVRYKEKSAKKWSKPMTVSANSKSVTIKKLKKGKTYQIQVRSYKKITKGASKGTYYSAWSKAKLSKKVK